jgi:hypothetical protein
MIMVLDVWGQISGMNLGFEENFRLRISCPRFRSTAIYDKSSCQTQLLTTILEEDSLTTYNLFIYYSSDNKKAPGLYRGFQSERIINVSFVS